MIKANELRVGNWVQDGKLTYQVGEIEGDFGSANAIPLTPEILEKCGFKAQKLFFEKTIRYNEDDIFSIAVERDFNGIVTVCGSEVPTKIIYLHQLQNLYFALTGQELNPAANTF